MVNPVYRTVPVTLVVMSAPYGDTMLLVPGISGEVTATGDPNEIYPLV